MLGRHNQHNFPAVVAELVATFLLVTVVLQVCTPVCTSAPGLHSVCTAVPPRHT